MNKPERKGKGYAVAAGILFPFAAWFAFLGIYLYQGMINYKPLPNQVQEGDMVSALLIYVMFICAGFCGVVSAINLIVYFFMNRRAAKTDSIA